MQHCEPAPASPPRQLLPPRLLADSARTRRNGTEVAAVSSRKELPLHRGASRRDRQTRRPRDPAVAETLVIHGETAGTQAAPLRRQDSVVRRRRPQDDNPGGAARRGHQAPQPHCARRGDTRSPGPFPAAARLPPERSARGEEGRGGEPARPAHASRRALESRAPVPRRGGLT